MNIDDLQYLLEEKAEKEREVRIGSEAKERLEEIELEIESLLTSSGKANEMKTRIGELHEYLSRFKTIYGLRGYIMEELEEIKNL